MSNNYNNFSMTQKNEAGDSPAAVRNQGALRDSGAIEGVADADTTN